MARKTVRTRPGEPPTKGAVDRPVEASLPGPLNYTGIAILEFDDAWVSPTMAFAREVAVAFPAGLPTLSWLVQLGNSGTSSRAATSSSGCAASRSIAGGLGLPATVVAQELADAVGGYRVLSSDPPRIHQWLRQLFAHLDKPGPPFEVGDLYDFFQDLQCLPAEQRDAIQAASRMVRAGERAAAEAARHAAYTAALTIRVQARWNETTSHSQLDPGPVGP